ncbi:hypothetical protein PAQ31011_03758 [Pandoraea aquatica]|uniref:PilX/PilW C-terminal domain-containing protein n=1 Tax=Pandoraea aquatica TaxID=2508290 RepID=A0A5E4X8X5_9BURK|nr:pilus assembly protein [Pandoraea aquatica]VVE32784.1 hypothetical protein PAQ31011_03758 [Pandoraea aquatica]
MVGVFIVMWLAALMALAASGMQHRELATRFIAYTNDRVFAFGAAHDALRAARARLVGGAEAPDIAAPYEFDEGPHGVIGARYRDGSREPNQMANWIGIGWKDARVVAVSNARYFIERIAFTEYLPDAREAKAARASLVRRYRVNAMGCGKLPGTRVLLQAIYEVRASRGRNAAGVAVLTSFSSRRLNWREVATWHDSAISTRVPGARREHCDA